MSPVSGFKLGERVLTPSGAAGVVTGVTRKQGREYVFVGVSGKGTFEFAASALRCNPPPRPKGLP